MLCSVAPAVFEVPPKKNVKNLQLATTSKILTKPLTVNSFGTIRAALRVEHFESLLEVASGLQYALMSAICHKGGRASGPRFPGTVSMPRRTAPPRSAIGIITKLLARRRTLPWVGTCRPYLRNTSQAPRHVLLAVVLLYQKLAPNMPWHLSLKTAVSIASLEFSKCF